MLMHGFGHVGHVLIWRPTWGRKKDMAYDAFIIPTYCITTQLSPVSKYGSRLRRTNIIGSWLPFCRAGVRHVRGGRPNRAAEFRGPPILASLQLTAPSRVQTLIKYTSLHNRLGVLKCSKTHLQQTRISDIFWAPVLDPPLNTMNRAADCLTPALPL